MIVHTWTVVCSKAFIDRDTNALALIDVVEELTVAGATPEHVPVLVPFPCAIVSYWRREDSSRPCDGNLRMQVLGPRGTVLGEATGRIDLHLHTGYRTIIRMDAFPIEAEGVHEVRVAHNEGGPWQEDLTYPIRVRFGTAPTTAREGTPT